MSARAIARIIEEAGVKAMPCGAMHPDPALRFLALPYGT